MQMNALLDCFDRSSERIQTMMLNKCCAVKSSMMTFIRHFPWVVPVPAFLEFYLPLRCHTKENKVHFEGKYHYFEPKWYGHTYWILCCMGLTDCLFSCDIMRGLL